LQGETLKTYCRYVSYSVVYNTYLHYLQCAIPVFEGLLPSPYNESLLDLLFELATWHGLAKLRMHTDTTLNFLDSSTTRLGQFLRSFMKATAKEYVTKDLPSEEAVRGRRKANKAAKGTGGSTDQGHRRSGQQTSGPKVRYFNFQTYKLHALGDYVEAIRKFGTSDNYSTQPVCFCFFNYTYLQICYRENVNTDESNGSILV
jgi:hypothetical protein